MEKIGRVGKFWTTRGFFFRGIVIGDSETHITIEDVLTKKKIEMLKTSIERIEWE